MSNRKIHVRAAYLFNLNRKYEILHSSFTKVQSRMVETLKKRVRDLNLETLNLRLEQIEDANRDALYVHDHDPKANDHLLAQASASRAFNYVSVNETTKDTIRVIGVLSADLNRWLKAFDSDTIEGVTLLLKETSFLEDFDERDFKNECDKKLAFIDNFRKKKKKTI